MSVRGNPALSTQSDFGSGTLFSTAYSYQNISDTQTTPRVRFRNVRVGDSGTLLEGKKYEYDALGNITRISQSVSPYYPLVEYSYDAQNQIIKETYYDGSGTGTAHVTDCYDYTYDTAGNLLTAAKNGTVTQTYTYGNSDWKDLLTSVNGASISYDSSGNPTSYSNSRGSYTYLRWDKGRQLSAIMVRVSGMEYATCDYDVNGIRTRKELNESGYIYYTQNGKLMREVGQFDGVTKRQVIDFIYDESGRPFAMNYSTDSGNSFTKYYYILNLQGDVVKLVTASGSEVASYAYDAWGNILSQSGSMADKNPLRYRGYYYDVETGFYYLQSRYYDPANRRFINADSYSSTGQGFVGTNMFAYCGNNPVRRIDSAGMNWFEDIWESISSWANDTFGASASAEYQVKREKEYSPMFLNLFLTIKKGVKETLTKSVSGDSSKPTSVYAIARHDNYLLSSVGIKRNYPNGSATLSIGFDDIGFSGAYTDKNVTYSGGITIDISQLKVGVQIAKTIKQRDNLSITSYTNVSITVAGILAVVAYATTGQDDLLQGFQPA